MDPMNDGASNGARVFVANYAGHDYAPLARFGKPVFITKGFISFQGLDRVKFQVAQGLMGCTADDYLALSGTNIINVIAALLWFQMHGKVKLLNFDKDARQYRELVINTENNEQLLTVLGSQS
jgi:hypothetical protein